MPRPDETYAYSTSSTNFHRLNASCWFPFFCKIGFFYHLLLMYSPADTGIGVLWYNLFSKSTGDEYLPLNSNGTLCSSYSQRWYLSRIIKRQASCSDRLHQTISIKSLKMHALIHLRIFSGNWDQISSAFFNCYTYYRPEGIQSC